MKAVLGRVTRGRLGLSLSLRIPAVLEGDQSVNVQTVRSAHKAHWELCELQGGPRAAWRLDPKIDAATVAFGGGGRRQPRA